MKQPNNKSTKENPVGRFMVAVGAVIEKGDSGKILIMRRAKDLDWQAGEWELDYGRLDQFEDIEVGLRRELFEETGLKDLEIGRILSVWHIYRGSEKTAENDLIGITYVCRTKEDAVVLSDEHIEYRWVAPKEALNLIKMPGIRRDVQMYMDQMIVDVEKP